MFVLRRVSEELVGGKIGVVISNNELGDSYQKYAKELTPVFYDVCKMYYADLITDNVSSVIVGGNGTAHLVFSSNKKKMNDAYIMTEGGKTFEKL